MTADGKPKTTTVSGGGVRREERSWFHLLSVTPASDWDLSAGASGDQCLGDRQRDEGVNFRNQEQTGKR